ncbi:Uncharacterized protein PCOAH_00025590 [Plasmodium coatneyi]|uniref:RING-type domain-containing protein n=1 Tax=Plasmodium coatneyi TaxID=208452 RepID=A0A1B1DZQ8_9APIC|nr:Uncharacterized protein PCOAH_00025590 [Plasmodium coatneyi]ANQ08125.1 Uncharacterized protein PCOAH_00025590 [Plasmodium coatneyi]
MGDGEESNGVRDEGQLAHDPADGGTSETSNVYEDAMENGDAPNGDGAQHRLDDAAHLPTTTVRNRFCRNAPNADDAEKCHKGKPDVKTVPQQKELDPPKDESEKEHIPSELECAICMKLLIIPVTIPCGHNFCRDCLEKAKEYKNTCPLCRSNMGDKKNINILLADLIKEKYPLTYAKRVEEMEMIKREKEKKILKERFDAIKNSSVIPLFKVPLVSGPYFPGEVFDLNIYNEKFIDLIELISSERTFAITSSKDKSDNGDEKMYGIHVKILQQNKTNQVLCIKCVANFRVILYNIIHFHQYENYIASHSPLFDESISLNFFEYNLLRGCKGAAGAGAGPGSSPDSSPCAGNHCDHCCKGLKCNSNCTKEGSSSCDKQRGGNTTSEGGTCKCAVSGTSSMGMNRECTNQTTVDLGKKKVEELKKLLNRIELEDDINSISSYYDQCRSIMSNPTDTNDYNVYNAVNYYACIIFSRICLLCIRYQLNRFGNAGIRLFNSKFRNVKLTCSEPSNQELENFSYSLSSAIISRSILKWRWFKTTNTTERLESITQYFLKKKNKSILALDNSRSPIIHRLFMLDSISSSLLILVFISVIIFVKYFLY